MPAVSGGYLGAGRRVGPVVTQGRRRSAQPGVPAQVPHRTAPSAPQRTVFNTPLGPVNPVGQGQHLARVGVRQAAKALPPEHQLPAFPTLKSYTTQQRAVIRQRTVAAVQHVAKQRGIPGAEAIRTLYNEGDDQTRRSLRVYGRAVKQDQQSSQAKALTQLARTPIQPNPAALTQQERLSLANTGTIKQPASVEAHRYLAGRSSQGTLRSLIAKLPQSTKSDVYQQIAMAPSGHARPGPKQGLLGSVTAPIASAEGFALDPQHNFLVASAPAVGQLVGPIARNLVSLPRDVVNSSYYTAAAGVEAAQGRPQRLHQLAQSLWNGDPLILAARGKFGDAARAFHNAPVSTALEIGGLRALPRTAGRLAGRTLDRGEAVLPGTVSGEARIYRSRSPLSQAVADAIDRHKISKAEAGYAAAQAADHSGELPSEHVDAMYREAAAKDPRLMSPDQVRHLADVHEAGAQPLKRRGRAEVSQQVAPHEVTVRQGGHAQTLAVQGIAPARTGIGRHFEGQAIWHGHGGDHPVKVTGFAGAHDGRDFMHVEGSKTAIPRDELVPPGGVDVKSFRADLAKYRDSLAKPAETLKGRRLRANTKLRNRIDEVLKLPDEQLGAVARHSREIARITNAQEERNIALKQLDPEEALRSRIMSYALTHMGARKAVETHRLEEWQRRADEATARGQTPPRRPEPVLTVAESTRLSPKEAISQARRLDHEASTATSRDVVRTLRAKAQLLRRSHVVTRHRILQPDEILAHMHAHGVDPKDIAFVTQREGALGDGAFNRRVFSKDLTRPGLPTHTRTGGAVLQGLLDTHPSRLRANVVRLQQLEAADKHYVNSVNDVANRYPAGHPQAGEIRQFDTKTHGLEWAKDSAYDQQGNRIHGAPEWRIIRINPWGGRDGQLQQLIEHGDPEGFVKTKQGLSHPISHAVEDAVSEHATGDGPWAAVPAEWADRLIEHSQVYRSSSPTLRAITMMFRNTVLPTSIPWLFGNASEATIRAAVRSPRIVHNILTFRRVMKVIEATDPEEAARIRDNLGVGHYGMSEVSNTYTSSTQFASSNKYLRGFAQALHQLRHTPGPKQVADAYKTFTDFVFHTVNSGLEHPLREAMAGAHIRDQFATGALKQAGEQAIHDAAKGLRGTPAQVRLADEVRRAYGQYEGFSPGQRKFMVLYSPFMAWSLNAVRFVLGVLPRDHPALTALLAAQNTATADWRKQHGLDEFASGAVPSFLMGTVPGGGGGHINAARYSPFGFFGDPGNTIASLILPQFSTSLHALVGQDWSGNADPSLKRTDQKLLGAAVGMLEPIVPFYGRVNQALGYGTSFPKALLATENPLRNVKKRVKSGSKSSGGGAWGSAANTGGSSGGGWGSAAGSSSGGTSGGWGSAAGG